MRHRIVLWALAAASVLPASADDKWEFGVAGGDDDSSTPNSLVHGRAQAHDLEGPASPPDEDWFRIPVRARQSYEVRASGSTVVFSIPGGPVCQAGFCATLARVNAGGTILQQPVNGDGDQRSPVIRFTAAASGVEYVRVRGAGGLAWGPNDEYTLDASNTTLFVPRFNNTGTQTTILLVQNTTPFAVDATVDFWSGGGVLLASQGIAFAAHQLSVLPTSGIGALGGQSGSVSITHDGSYGALAGKAVSLEPATGFTFDTMAVNLPR
jgi:hypothetical protein